MGKSSDDVIGMFGEGKYNASGNRLISFLTEVGLVMAVSSPWNHSGLELDLLSSRYLSLITNSNLLQVSGSVQVDETDIGKLDHFLVWMELGRTVKKTLNNKTG